MVAIIVLAWNQCALTLACISSLSSLDYTGHQIIVVDNGSQDGTAEAVRQRYPGVTVLENRENLGFAEGNNVGIRWAMEHGADYVILLNNDTVVDSHMLTALIAAAESDSQVGIVGPLIYYYDQPEVIWSAGSVIDWRTVAFRRLPAGVGCHPSAYEVDYVTGCALCTKRQVIEQVGLLDPRYFLYYEETDWCLRGRAKGYKVMVAPQARMWHKVAATIGQGSPAITYYMTRNVFLLLDKNLHGTQRLWALAISWLREVRTVLAYTLKPCYQHLRRDRDARVFALRDAWVGRWGKMGPDVERVCHVSPV